MAGVEENATFPLLVDDEESNFTIAEDLNGTALAVAVGLECLISLVINVAVLLCTFAQPASLKKPSTIFLSLLVGANLIMTVFCMPFTAISAAMGGWIFGNTDAQKQSVCTFVGFMFGLSVGFSTHTLALISVDRFLFIVKPLVYIKYMKLKTALAIIACLYPTLTLINSTPLFGLGHIKYSIRVSSCLPVWSGHTDYVIFFSVISIIPYSTILITSAWTFVHTNNFFIRRLKMSVNMQLTEEQKQSRHNAYNYRMCNLMGIFGALFIAHWLSLTPYVSVSVIGLFLGFDSIPNAVYATALCLYFLHTITVPQVQAYFRPELRKIIIALWKKTPKCYQKIKPLTDSV